MSVPQQLTWDGADGAAVAKGGTLWLGPLSHRPSQQAAASPLVSLYGPGGESYAASVAGTIEGPSTIPTLSRAAPAGSGATVDACLRVTSTTGIKSRMPMVLGTGDDTRPLENVRVRTVLDATGLTLFGPLLNDHETGAKLGGCRIYAAITSAQCNTRFRKGRAVWQWGAEGLTTRDQVSQIAAEVVRYPLRRLATADDLRRLDAVWYSNISRFRDSEEILDEGWAECGRQIARRDLWGLVTSEALRWPTALFAAWIETMGWGAQWGERAQAWRAEAMRVLEDSILSNPVDTDEDGDITEREQPDPRRIRFLRAS